MDCYIVRYMVSKRAREKIILAIILLILVVVNYGFIDGFLEKKFMDEGAILVDVERVIDGDTLVVNGSSIRLLGINSPEKGEIYSVEATVFLEELVMNKSIVLRSTGKDRYYRELGYLFDVESRKNINLEIVKNGYANFYFPSGKDEYYDEFVKGWEECLKKGVNLCEPSTNECSECIKLEEWGYNKNTTLYNTCEIECNLEGWSIKDEGRKKFVFEDFNLEPGEGAQVNAEAFGVDYVWTKSGDSIFLRDDEGMLVVYDSY